MSLMDLKKNVYSQNGEDGVLEEVFKIMGVDKGYFVDIGAWNGTYLSNTRQFLDKGWAGLDIEGNRNHFVGLIDLANNFSSLDIMLRFVLPDEMDSLLSLYPVPKDFDLLNIDIDSYDYWLWANLKNYSPKVVVIESNGMAGEYIQPAKAGYKGKKGSSKESLIKLGIEKGYTFIGDVGNILFMRNDIYENCKSHLS